MILILPPPTTKSIQPIFVDVPTGSPLVRIFDPTRRNATALTFRANGPRKRFDHHRRQGPDREFGDFVVTMPTVTRPLHLLELRDNGALCAGTVAAIAKCEHRLSQPWSRYFYENATDFNDLDGLIYRNAHNDEPAVLLYERARPALVCPADALTRLDHPGLRPQLIHVMRQNNLTF
ncbi:MAG: RES family NAD+ phosphorylase [Thermomicrobiales bacterium]